MRRLKKPIVNTNICDPGISISRQRLTNAQTPLKSTAIIFTLFFIFTNPSMAAQTTLIFEMPEVPKAPSEEYPSEQLFETYTKRAPGPKGSSLKVDALRSQNLENAWSKSFRESTNVHQYFVDNIASKKDAIESQLRKALLSTKDVNRIEYLRLASDPVKIELTIRNSQIGFRFSNLSYSAKARVELHGAAHTLCGSNIWVKVSGKIYANGVYDPLSGQLDINGVDANESLNASCSRLPGKLLDPAIDSFANDMLGDVIDDMTRPILEQTIQLTSIEDLFSDSAKEAQAILGFNFVEDVWDALGQYIEGFTMGIEVGINRYGTDKHLLKFFAYQNPVYFTESAYWVTEKIIVDRGKWGKSTTTKKVRKTATTFICPMWAGTLNTYRLVPIKTGEKTIETLGTKIIGGRPVTTNVSKVIPVYGRTRLEKIPFGGLSYSSRYNANFGDVASCTSFTGLSSYLQFQNLGIMNTDNYK